MARRRIIKKFILKARADAARLKRQTELHKMSSSGASHIDVIVERTKGRLKRWAVVERST